MTKSGSLNRRGPRHVLRVLGTLALCANPLSAQTTVRIMPLGDSITESEAGRASYRYYLDLELHRGNYAFDFVGHNHGVYGGAPLHAGFDQDHAAHSGWQAGHVLLELENWARNARPDIALIHLGSNDIIRNQSPSSTVNELAQCIDILRSVNPNITVLLARIIPMATRAVEPTNALIPAMVANKDSAESRVVVVDHYASIDVGQHMLGDGVHPNDAGEQIMAATWLAALRPFLSPRDLQFARIGLGCSGTAPATSTVAPVVGQAASIGGPFTVTISDAPIGAATFGLLGFDSSSFHGVPLPIDLSPLGASACRLWVGPAMTFTLENFAGSASWTIAIPNDQVLVGHPYYQQVAFLQPGLNALGLTLSHAVRVTVVDR